MDNLDEKVEYWHTHDTGTTLREFLQMSEVEYLKFMYGIDLSTATTIRE